MTPTNHDRSEKARWKTKGYSGEPDDLETDLSDFLTDLRHMADEHGLDFDEALERSQRHYEFELETGREAA